MSERTADSATQQATEVAVAVVQRQGRFLIGRRTDDATLPGLWEFPGGKVRQGETAEAAARRECLEETGIRVIVGGWILSTTHRYEHDHVALHFFAAEPLDPHASPRAPFRWVPRHVLAGYEFPEANQPVLQRLNR